MGEEASAAAGPATTLWAPGRSAWWTSVLFCVGATCFLVGPIPGFPALVGARVDALVFFVGSLFFTTAAALQLRGVDHVAGAGSSRTRGRLWWSATIQFAGTVFFNASTFRALTVGAGEASYDRAVWQPDALGSICFLVSGALAYTAVAGGVLPREWRRETTVAAVNLAGCAAFGVSAVASYVVPGTTEPAANRLSDLTTATGALAFLVAAAMTLRQPRPHAGAVNRGPVPAGREGGSRRRRFR